MGAAKERLKTFTLTSLPTLDVAVIGALELFSTEQPPILKLPYRQPIVLGSGNASAVGKIIFPNPRTLFGDESSYLSLLETYHTSCDGVVIISASGSKHAPLMVAAAQAKCLPVQLITNTEDSAASALLPKDAVYVFPRNREPYTYNTSTYLGPILASTKESPQAILSHLEDKIKPLLLRHFSDYSAVTFIIPDTHTHLRSMVRTKFDELFGPMLTGRIFTAEEIKHAKTVVRSGEELFIALGVENNYYGLAKNRLRLPLPKDPGYALALSSLYYVVGRIQNDHPPYFAQNIERYCQEASSIFATTIGPIVE